MTDAAHLASHFRFARPEYTVILASLGIGRQWHVLDAGCGPGVFLPLLLESVGDGGMVTVVDVSGDHVQASLDVARQCGIGEPVRGAVASVTALPFPDGSFDAVWCANVFEYLSDSDVERTLLEFRRVVRPGGRVAVKDFDATCWSLRPFDPALLMTVLVSGLRINNRHVAGICRGIALANCLAKAGLQEVSQRTVLTERHSPLLPHEREFLTAFLGSLGRLGAVAPLSRAEAEQWARLGPSGAGAGIVDRPDFYYREGHVVAVGTVPA